MRVPKGFWIWGQFENEDKDYINYLKKKVQSKLISPLFEPHITLAGPFDVIDISFIDKIKGISLSHKSISLNLLQYEFENEKFRSFYIAVNKSNRLFNIRYEISQKYKFDINKVYKPHISLSYGVHLNHLKRELINELPVLKKTILVKKISIVDVNENINSWKIYKSFDLLN